MEASHSLEIAGQAALQPDPYAFPAEVGPRSAATIACSVTGKLKKAGKAMLTCTDGYEIGGIVLLYGIQGADLPAKRRARKEVKK